MNSESVSDILSGLADGGIDDRELLEVARWALREPGGIDALRDLWPTADLPVVHQYFCISRLGQGVSGTVFKALAVEQDPRFVALKLLQFASAEHEERFRQREIEILRSLDCPYVARYVDSGRAGGTTFLVMQLVAGEPLDLYLDRLAGGLPEKLAVVQRVCEVVAGLHAQGVIHRDLKPKHILVDAHGQPWIVDFGLSVVRTDDWPTQIRRARTELGSILGTIKYMSPEQAWGGMWPVDHRADIWALGIMLYEIATEGGYPYDLSPAGAVTGHDALLHRIQTETPRRPHIRDARYAGPLDTLISRCLAHEPHRRIESAEILAHDLARCLARQAIRTRRLPLTYRLKRIAIGLAAQWRYGLWASAVSAVLLFLLFITALLGVRSVAAQTPGSSHGIVIVGLGDKDIEEVPALASSNGIEGVTRNIRTWRAVHGRLMERLARVRPKTVVWDYFFQTQEAGDAAFARGVQALQSAGVPVVLAADRFLPNGSPELSQTLLGPIAEYVRVGLIFAHDMVAREGEFIVAIKRGDIDLPGLILSAADATKYPDCRLAMDLDAKTKTLRLIHQPMSGDKMPTVERVDLTTVYTKTGSDPAVQAGDIVACKAFPLKRPDYWEARVVSYAQTLTLPEKELAERCANRIVLVGDVREPRLFFRGDRHSVRYGLDVVDNVPGCFLIADGIRGMLSAHYLRLETPLSPPAFLVILGLAVFGCFLPTRLARYRLTRSRIARGLLLVSLPLVAGACLVVVVLSQQRNVVHVTMGLTALSLCMAASFAIEFARSRYLVPPTMPAVGADAS